MTHITEEQLVIDSYERTRISASARHFSNDGRATLLVKLENDDPAFELFQSGEHDALVRRMGRDPRRMMSDRNGGRDRQLACLGIEGEGRDLVRVRPDEDPVHHCAARGRYVGAGS